MLNSRKRFTYPYRRALRLTMPMSRPRISMRALWASTNSAKPSCLRFRNQEHGRGMIAVTASTSQNRFDQWEEWYAKWSEKAAFLNFPENIGMVPAYQHLDEKHRRAPV